MRPVYFTNRCFRVQYYSNILNGIDVMASTHLSSSRHRLLVFICLLVCSAGCSNPQPGPDKTLAGAVLGAGWGAGAGAVIGHQLSYAGEGAGIGAGFGFVSGALIGAGFDINEGAILDQERALAQLKVQNAVNSKQLEVIQARLDDALVVNRNYGVHQVYFDVDASNLRGGAVADLEVIADQVRMSPYAFTVHVVGHSDDAGTPDYNARLAEARARSVAAYLASRGISSDKIKIEAHGSTRPLASNSSPNGRQLNRRVDVYVTN